MEEEIKQENLTEVNKKVDEKVILEFQRKQREEQERTKMKKAMFLDEFGKSIGIVSKTCEKIGISRTIFYEWRKTDPEFAEAISSVETKRNDEVEDKLFSLIEKEDGPSVRFYLERRMPEYKQKMVNEVYAGERTLEDLIDEAKQNNGSKQQEPDSKSPENQKQEGDQGSVPVQCSPILLLGAKNTPQSNPEGAPKGNK